MALPEISACWRAGVRSSPRGDVLSTKMLVPSVAHRLGLRAFNMLVPVFQTGT